MPTLNYKFLFYDLHGSSYGVLHVIAAYIHLKILSVHSSHM